MSEATEPVLAVAVCDFGWGSIGKLRLILDELGGDPVQVLAEPGSVHLTSRFGIDHRIDVRTKEMPADLGLVINDPVAADTMAANGVPVLYVDSLPYLWTTQEDVPDEVDLYCVQRSPVRALPSRSPLAGREGIIWVDPIVPCPRDRCGGAGIVINVGGLHSPLSGDFATAYLNLVMVPLARLLAAEGHRVAGVCGNLDASATQELRAVLGSEVAVGPQSPYEFEEILRTADTLLTSPGSTTILQAAALGLPTVLLPPQNLSQILNAEIYSSPDTPVISWPIGVLDRRDIDELRPSGEDIVLEHIYGSICAAAGSPGSRAEVGRDLQLAVASVGSTRATLDGLVEPGRSGAGDVARLVRQWLSRGSRRAS